jgi:hypothetical protein
MTLRWFDILAVTQLHSGSLFYDETFLSQARQQQERLGISESFSPGMKSGMSAETTLGKKRQREN